MDAISYAHQHDCRRCCGGTDAFSWFRAHAYDRLGRVEAIPLIRSRSVCLQSQCHFTSRAFLMTLLYVLTSMSLPLSLGALIEQSISFSPPADARRDRELDAQLALPANLAITRSRSSSWLNLPVSKMSRHHPPDDRTTWQVNSAKRQDCADLTRRVSAAMGTLEEGETKRTKSSVANLGKSQCKMRHDPLCNKDCETHHIHAISSKDVQIPRCSVRAPCTLSPHQSLMPCPQLSIPL